MASQEYWLISAPGDKTCQQTWDKLQAATSKIEKPLSINSKYQLPDLKVGTLDTLVGLSDDLVKVDGYVEGVTRKLTQYMADILEEQKDKLPENMKVSGHDLQTYMSKWQWDHAKYPVKQHLRSIQVTNIDADLKVKSQAYNAIKNTLQSLERKQAGSLLSRDLSDLVKKEDFVLNSEYLSTLLVIVSKSSVNDWTNNYEKLCDMIVPRSSKKIYEDNEHALFSVTLFNKVIDEFKHHARDNRFIVRDFKYNEAEVQAGKSEITRLEADKKKQFGPLMRWLKTNFGECVIAFVHIKVLRLFVESVLRYGLPVNFQAALLLPTKKSSKRLREALMNLYRHLDSTANTNLDIGFEIPGVTTQQGDYYPYVYFPVNVDFSVAN
ncbi:V-type proton ATPase subunit C [Trichoplax sp. H2]|uniref:V-type proton ATPase subunit C n=1 Tax=Trichoplax adhaerens TaxID=10228 RepID=B3RKI5_TRIAD|nr:hypothetical protein TRIADDRAFT_19844 [Trichoplax adhaerens]EDV28606.1 hypothetical protein TRIADDRAFT_19844 [Trichoplax adhaerens]RDD44699.1 V-type proton ATPase subunit C [Trichoplax sp. H2]|eukprot:XP_002107808.1 hypothetical protein TRIADDRAFT_19844 [Trichoplax adhaerens]